MINFNQNTKIIGIFQCITTVKHTLLTLINATFFM